MFAHTVTYDGQRKPIIIEMLLKPFDKVLFYLYQITALFEVYPVSSEPFSCPAFIMNTQEYIERLASVQWDYELFIQSFQLPEYFDLLAVLPKILSNISTTELHR